MIDGSGDILLIILSGILLVGMFCYAAYDSGKDACAKTHPLRCKCNHELDAHADTMPCSICDCKDFDGRVEDD